MNARNGMKPKMIALVDPFTGWCSCLLRRIVSEKGIKPFLLRALVFILAILTDIWTINIIYAQSINVISFEANQKLFPPFSSELAWYISGNIFVNSDSHTK